MPESRDVVKRKTWLLPRCDIIDLREASDRQLVSILVPVLYRLIGRVGLSL